jgi:hypothetical protein
VTRGGAPCPLCAGTNASLARISTVRRGKEAAVAIVDCHDCGIFVFHDSTLADGPLNASELRRLRTTIHRGALHNTPCDVTRELVGQIREEAGRADAPAAT